MSKTALVVAMIGAGCALAGHGLLPSSHINWELQPGQAQVARELRVQQQSAAGQGLYRLVVHIEPGLVSPADTGSASGAQQQGHTYELEVVCARNGERLRRQSFSEFPVASGGKFMVQLPAAIEQCFRESEAVLDVYLRIINAAGDVAVNGSFYIETVSAASQ